MVKWWCIIWMPQMLYWRPRKCWHIVIGSPVKAETQQNGGVKINEMYGKITDEVFYGAQKVLYN